MCDTEFVTVISHRNLMNAAQRHPNSVASVERWYQVVAAADCRHFVKLRAVFPSADQIGTALVFIINGNQFRLICCVDFERQWLFFRALLTHAEYNRIEVRTLCP